MARVRREEENPSDRGRKRERGRSEPGSKGGEAVEKTRTRERKTNLRGTHTVREKEDLGEKNVSNRTRRKRGGKGGRVETDLRPRPDVGNSSRVLDRRQKSLTIHTLGRVHRVLVLREERYEGGVRNETSDASERVDSPSILRRPCSPRARREG